MVKSKYIYPDVGDTNTTIFIEQNEPYEGYWKKSQEYVLQDFENIAKKNKNQTLLDIGTGDAKLLEKYCKYFDKITSIEPDEKRLKLAKEKLKNYKNVTYLNSTFLTTDLKNQKYDIILCSHVLQIITTPRIQDFIDKLYKHLKPKGRIVLLTSHAKGNSDYYHKNYIAYSDIKIKKISKDEFNKIRTNDEHVLGTHHFTINNLKQLLSKFRIMDIKIFHLMHKKNIIDKVMFRDHFYNKLPNKKKYGEGVYLLLRKPRKNR